MAIGDIRSWIRARMPVVSYERAAERRRVVREAVVRRLPVTPSYERAAERRAEVRRRVVRAVRPAVRRVREVVRPAAEKVQELREARDVREAALAQMPIAAIPVSRVEPTAAARAKLVEIAAKIKPALERRAEPITEPLREVFTPYYAAAETRVGLGGRKEAEEYMVLAARHERASAGEEVTKFRELEHRMISKYEEYERAKASGLPGAESAAAYNIMYKERERMLAGKERLSIAEIRELERQMAKKYEEYEVAKGKPFIVLTEKEKRKTVAHKAHEFAEQVRELQMPSVVGAELVREAVAANIEFFGAIPTHARYAVPAIVKEPSVLPALALISGYEFGKAVYHEPVQTAVTLAVGAGIIKGGVRVSKPMIKHIPEVTLYKADAVRGIEIGKAQALIDIKTAEMHLKVGEAQRGISFKKPPAKPDLIGVKPPFKEHVLTSAERRIQKDILASEKRAAEMRAAEIARREPFAHRELTSAERRIQKDILASEKRAAEMRAAEIARHKPTVSTELVFGKAPIDVHIISKRKMSAAERQAQKDILTSEKRAAEMRAAEIARHKPTVSTELVFGKAPIDVHIISKRKMSAAERQAQKDILTSEKRAAEMRAAETARLARYKELRMEGITEIKRAVIGDTRLLKKKPTMAQMLWREEAAVLYAPSPLELITVPRRGIKAVETMLQKSMYEPYRRPRLKPTYRKPPRIFPIGTAHDYLMLERHRDAQRARHDAVSKFNVAWGAAQAQASIQALGVKPQVDIKPKFKTIWGYDPMQTYVEKINYEQLMDQMMEQIEGLKVGEIVDVIPDEYRPSPTPITPKTKKPKEPPIPKIIPIIPEDEKKRALRKRRKAEKKWWLVENPIAALDEIMIGRRMKGLPKKKK